jgi:hypothetical protein
MYQEDVGGASVAAASSVKLPDEQRQSAIESSIKKRISRLLGNINWFGFDQDRLVKQVFHNVVKMLINSELYQQFSNTQDMAYSGLRWCAEEYVGARC